MTRCRTRPNNLPLIAVPRLLADLLEVRAQQSDTSAALVTARNTDRRYGQTELELYREIEALNSISILDYAPERLASSLADLWEDLVGSDSCEDFLRYNRAWIAHAVLLGCSARHAIETIERVIEVACCLDLLCQEHVLAVNVVEALGYKAISRLAAWKDVRAALTQKMDEISRGALAYNIIPNTRFRATRDSKVEYWVLSRAFADEELLMAESLTLQPQNGDAGDVESRITNLETVLLTMTDQGVSTPMIAAAAATSDEGLSGLDDLTETENSITSSSDTESLDDRESDQVRRVARQTQERVSRRLENLRNKVQSNATIRKQATSDVDMLSVPAPRPTLRVIDPLDQRTILRISAAKDGNSSRRGRPTPTNRNEYEGRKDAVGSNGGRQLADRDVHGEITIDDEGRWKKNIGYASK